jgi:toxin ParE1/3/4
MTRGRAILRRDVPHDIEGIIAYIEQFNIDAADRFRVAVFQAIEGLASMPGKGSPKFFRRRSLKGIRSWSVPGYRKFLIFYRPVEGGIDVIAVFHGARNLRPLLIRRTD